MSQIFHNNQSLFFSLVSVLAKPCGIAAVAGIGNQKIAVIYHVTVSPDNSLPWVYFFYPCWIDGVVKAGRQGCLSAWRIGQQHSKLNIRLTLFELDDSLGGHGVKITAMTDYKVDCVIIGNMPLYAL